MVESRRQERDIALPLLSDAEDHQERDDRAASENWNRPSSHGKYSQWVAFPFRRIIHVLLAVAALVALGLVSYGSFVGFHAYRRLVFPHRAVHASPATIRDGSRVVKPYFAPKTKDGVHNGTLLVRIWFKEEEENHLPMPTYDDANDKYYEDIWRQERQLVSMDSIGETGYIDDTLAGVGGQTKWIEQFATEIPITDIERTENMVAHVTLPGQTM
jgi:hypothetical protein